MLGNPEGMAGLEVTVSGPTLQFSAPARICLTGADFGAKLDGEPVERDDVLKLDHSVPGPAGAPIFLIWSVSTLMLSSTHCLAFFARASVLVPFAAVPYPLSPRFRRWA